MKKAVAHLVPFIEKEKEQMEQELKAQGAWDENVRLLFTRDSYFSMLYRNISSSEYIFLWLVFLFRNGSTERSCWRQLKGMFTTLERISLELCYDAITTGITNNSVL